MLVGAKGTRARVSRSGSEGEGSASWTGANVVQPDGATFAVPVQLSIPTNLKLVPKGMTVAVHTLNTTSGLWEPVDGSSFVNGSAIAEVIPASGSLTS